MPPFTMKIETDCYKYVPPISHKVNDRDKGFPISGHEGQEGKQRYKSTLSLTSAIDEGGWSKRPPQPGLLNLKRDTRYPLYRARFGSHGKSVRVQETSLLQGFDPRTVQPVPSLALLTELFRPTSNLTCFPKVRSYHARSETSS